MADTDDANLNDEPGEGTAAVPPAWTYAGGWLIPEWLKGFLPEDLLSRIAWLFLILPGFLSYSGTMLIAPIEIRSEFEVLAFSFTFLLVNLTVTFLIFLAGAAISHRWRKPPQKRNFGVSGIAVSFVFVLFVVSILSGVVGGVMLERDLFFKFAKVIPFVSIPIQDSTRSPLDRILMQNQAGLSHFHNPSPDGRLEDDRPSDSNQAFAQITLNSGVIYEGWPLYFDSRRSQEQIYLSPACLLTKSIKGTEVKPVAGPGVVVFERDIRSVVLLDYDATLCRVYWHQCTSGKCRSGLLGIVEPFRYEFGAEP